MQPRLEPFLRGCRVEGQDAGVVGAFAGAAFDEITQGVHREDRNEVEREPAFHFLVVVIAARAAIGAAKSVEEVGAIFADFVFGELGAPLRKAAAG